MQQKLSDALVRLESTMSLENSVSAIGVGVYLVLGGILSLYIRFLYERCSASASDTDSITRVFPLLTLVTTGVISVVKSSLALSLGLVGALSIVRFRAAIKEPEELAYLFLCTAVGLSLGAEQPAVALMLVLVATVFIVGAYLTGRAKRNQKMLITITGDASQFGDENSGVVAAIQSVSKRFKVQRLDLENGRGQIRVVVGPSKSFDQTSIMSKLHQLLPDCDLSYVDLSSTI